MQVIACDNAAHALHAPQLPQVTFALIDVNMPDIDGYALAAQLRQLRPPSQLTLIMLGAMSEQISQEELDQLGIQSFLIKPVDPHELMAVLNGSDSSNNLPFASEVATTNTAAQVPMPKVLLVEDTPINQTLETILLTRMGFEVTIANNGVEAVEAFMRERFDLILMDIQMPEMGGIEATQLIRDRENTQHLIPTPIIAVTANALKGDREKYIESGMDAYVSKPISAESLKTEIQKLLPTLGKTP
jgi:CheY-like chemotaxis protein